MNERVGIFGGTFDPPHRGHLKVARTACDHLSLDRLLWIPAGTPPHKNSDNLTQSHHRLEMTACMVSEDDRFELETFEVSKEEASFTVETLQHLHEREPGWNLVLIMGEDQWNAFDSWVRPDTIRELAEIAVYRRSDAENTEDAAESASAPDHWLPGSLRPEASTAIRDMVSKEGATEDDLLDSVADYIQLHGLYK